MSSDIVVYFETDAMDGSIKKRIKHDHSGNVFEYLPHSVVARIADLSCTGIVDICKKQSRLVDLATVCKHFKSAIMPFQSVRITANSLMASTLTVGLSLRTKLGIFEEKLGGVCGYSGRSNALVTSVLAVVFKAHDGTDWLGKNERTYKQVPLLKTTGVRDLTVSCDYLKLKVPLAYPRLLVAMCPNLTSLSLSKMNNLSHHFYKGVGQMCPHIQKLAVYHCRVFTECNFDVKGCCVSSWANLRELDLRGVNVTMIRKNEIIFDPAMFLVYIKNQICKLTVQWRLRDAVEDIDSSMAPEDLVRGLGEFVVGAQNLRLLRAPLTNPRALMHVTGAMRPNTILETSFL